MGFIPTEERGLRHGGRAKILLLLFPLSLSVKPECEDSNQGVSDDVYHNEDACTQFLRRFRVPISISVSVAVRAMDLKNRIGQQGDNKLTSSPFIEMMAY
jgi:hypothetical protein